ncbi:MAG: hypothetical protein RI885_2006 [Actinomycetota bacterium]
MSSASDLRAIALAEFASVGFGGTSLQRIADRAGLSKSAVLYHFASKEALLAAAIGPAIDRMEALLGDFTSQPLTAENRLRFLEGFTDLLLAHRLEVHMFINQGPSLVDVPVIDRANELVLGLARFFDSATSSTIDKMRFGVALGGAAYTLCTVQTLGLEPTPDDETRAALITIMSELLAPVATSLD